MSKLFCLSTIPNEHCILQQISVRYSFMHKTFGFANSEKSSIKHHKHWLQLGKHLKYNDIYVRCRIMRFWSYNNKFV